MLYICLAGVLGLAALSSTSEAPADTLSARASAIEAKVAGLTQQNKAMQAGKAAAEAMRSSDLSRSDRYYLGGLAFEAYIVAHLNAPSAEALCEARRVARAMQPIAATATERAAARGLVGQANDALAQLTPPGQCARASKRAPKGIAVGTPPPTPDAPPVVNPAPPSPESGETPVKAISSGVAPPAAIGVVAPFQGPAAPSPAPRPLAPRVRWSPRAWVGLGTVVVGAGLVAGMGASLRGRWAANDLIADLDRQVEGKGREPTAGETAEVEQANLRWRRWTAAAIVTGTVGVVAIVTGTVLLATGLRRRTLDVAPWGGATSAGLMLSGRF